jgi:mannose-6-phosphate isomerase
MNIFDPADLATLRPWLLQHVVPFWLSRIRSTSGFEELLDAAGAPVRSNRRHVLVQARLTYVFSHAALMGGGTDARQAAEHGYATLTRAFLAPDGGWYRHVTTDGAVTDPARNFYDLAFVMFALAWYARLSGEAEALAHADATWAFLESRMADPHGGFVESWLPGTETALPRRQNPHMHLLEALLALHVAAPHGAWLARARGLVDLFARCLRDRRTGTLVEFFTADLKPAPGREGRWREPGHHFEWVWLLHDYHRHARAPGALELADQLYDFAARHGFETDETCPGGVLDGVDADGSVASDAKTLWPQTEYIKACVARAEDHRDPQAWDLVTRHLHVLATHYMRPDGASWHNQIARNGTSMQETTPARVLYHLFLAIAEVDRVRALRG